MSEANESPLSAIDGGRAAEAKPDIDPRYTLRAPTLEDIGSLAGVIARGAAGDSDLVTRILTGKVGAGEFGAVLVRAIVDAQAREDFYFVLGDMWIHEPENLDEPPERWDYEPDPSLVERGQAYGREERWKTITRFNRKRVAKRYEVGALPASVLRSMWGSIRESVDISDFLSTASLQAEESSGESETESSDDMDGRTDK